MGEASKKGVRIKFSRNNHYHQAFSYQNGMEVECSPQLIFLKRILSTPYDDLQKSKSRKEHRKYTQAKEEKEEQTTLKTH